MSDERLARMVARGSERAFVALYQRYSQPLFRYCRSIVGNDADAQDVLQSSLASALVALRNGTRDAPLRPWLFRISHNEAVTLLRRRRPSVELSEQLEPVAPSAVEDVLRRERLATLVADLQELGERQRGALVMRELSGLSHAEIAVVLGVSVGAAKQAIFEARRALLELAEGREMTCGQARRLISDGDGRVLRARRVRAHLRHCADCTAFADAIPRRRADLHALAPPLAPVAAAGVLSGVLGAGSGHGGSGAAWLAAGAGGKSAGAVLAAKAAVGVAVVATATVGATHLLRSEPHARQHVSHVSKGARGAGSGVAAGRHTAGAALTTAGADRSVLASRASKADSRAALPLSQRKGHAEGRSSTHGIAHRPSGGSLAHRERQAPGSRSRRPTERVRPAHNRSRQQHTSSSKSERLTPPASPEKRSTHAGGAAALQAPAPAPEPPLAPEHPRPGES